MSADSISWGLKWISTPTLVREFWDSRRESLSIIFDARSTKINLPLAGPREAARVQRQMAEGGIGNLGKPPRK
jgi:hypothetical protein